jgi:hypothetical protein
MKRSIERLAENDEIDRILSREDEILPSSGFAACVMDAVRREAAAPLPIPFPWKRALPGLVAAGIALALVVIAAIWAIAQSGTVTTSQPPALAPSAIPPTLNGIKSAVVWTVLSLIAALLSVKLSMRLSSDGA